VSAFVSKRLTTDLLEIAYEVSGPEDGKPVAALHGWPDSIHCWNALLPALHDGGCRVYTPYLRGFGPTHFHEKRTMRSGQIGALLPRPLAVSPAAQLDGARPARARSSASLRGSATLDYSPPTRAVHQARGDRFRAFRRSDSGRARAADLRAGDEA
jgi:hypothetical protein